MLMNIVNNSSKDVFRPTTKEQELKRKKLSEKRKKDFLIGLNEARIENSFGKEKFDVAVARRDYIQNGAGGGFIFGDVLSQEGLNRLEYEYLADSHFESLKTTKDFMAEKARLITWDCN